MRNGISSFGKPLSDDSSDEKGNVVLSKTCRIVGNTIPVTLLEVKEVVLNVAGNVQ